MIDALKTELRRLRTRVAAMVARGVISSLAESGKTVRLKIEILDGEVEEDVELLQPYGFHISPPAGSEVIALGVAGARSNTVAICPHHPDQRPKNAASKTGGLYTDGVWRVFIDANGIVHIGAETGAAWIARADYTDARISALQSKLDALITHYNGPGHVHTSAAPGSPTSAVVPPSGIAVLGSQTSVAATKGKTT